MKSLKKPLVLSLAAATAFAGAAALSGCKEDKGKHYFLFSDYELSLRIEKKEYTLLELEANGYRVPIDIICTNTSEEAIQYANEVSFFPSGCGVLFTHKENRRYIAYFKIGEFVWQGVDLFKGDPISYFYGAAAPTPDFPDTVEPGESFSLTMYYDFSDMTYGEDGKVNTIHDDVLIMDGGGSPDNEIVVATGTDNYNFDYSLGDDEEYLAVGLGDYDIYSSTQTDGDEEVPIQTGYYSLVFGSTVFVNCIHIMEE